MSEPCVMIVDDEEALLETYACTLEKTFLVKRFDRPKAALFELESGVEVDVIITDLMMPEMSGIDFMKNLRKRGLQIPVIVATGYADKQTAIKAVQLGAFSFLEKPINYAELFNVVHKAAVFSQLRRQNTKYFELCQSMLSGFTEIAQFSDFKAKFKPKLDDMRLQFRTLTKLQEVLLMLDSEEDAIS